MQEEHDKKNPGAGSDDQANVPVKPAALADSDLDKVAGGNIWQGDPSLTNNPKLRSNIVRDKFTTG
jgi:hypothetical protein